MYDPKLSTIEDDYYVYDEQKYYLFFPYDWVQNMFPGTGPKMCEKCVLHGSKKGIFIGYCYDCANYVYDCKRGHGFENCLEDIDMVNKETSANYTYLKYTKHMNVANDPTVNIGISRSNSFSLKTISKESDEMIEAVRRSNSITSTNSELSFPSRANSVDNE
jgi:hypothetical protein